MPTARTANDVEAYHAVPVISEIRCVYMPFRYSFMLGLMPQLSPLPIMLTTQERKANARAHAECVPICFEASRS